MSFVVACLCVVTGSATAEDKRPHISIRGIYGGVPVELLEHGTLQEFGVNAIFTGSDEITEEQIALLKKQGAKVFAEFNTMHVASYLKEHPDAAPIERADGKGERDGRVLPSDSTFAVMYPFTKFHDLAFGMGRHVTSKATRIMTQPNSDKNTGSVTATSGQIQHDFTANDTGKFIVAPPD